MEKWMRRRLDNLRSQLQRQELLLDSAKRRDDFTEVLRLEEEMAATKSDMVRIIAK